MYDGDKALVIEEGMVPRQKRVEVEKRDPATGKPSLITASSIEAARKFAKASKIDSTNWTFTPNAHADISRGWLNFSGFEPEAELAVLKSALLTFDHLLADDQAKRFTRHKVLSDVRKLVRQCVIEKQWGRFADFVLGLQYDSVSDLKRLRKQVVGKISPFEHVIVAATNRATRCLDILFWVASVDPFAFRLARNWDQEPFTAVVVSGVLKGTSTMKPVWLPEQIYFRPKPHLSSVRIGVSEKTAISDAQKAAGEMSAFRLQAIKEAAHLVEHECDDFVRDKLARDAIYLADLTGHGLICEAVRRRLEVMYALVINDPNKRAQLCDILQRRFVELDPKLLTQSVPKNGHDIECLSWDRWLNVYRQLLKDATELFDLPGGLEPSGTEIEFRREGV